MAHKKGLFTKEDYFKQLDEMLAMPGIKAPAQPSSFLTRIRQAVQKRGIPNKARGIK